MKTTKRALCLLLTICLLLALAPVTASAVSANITAQAAIVMDFETGDVLWSRDPDTLRVPASMTKNMTAFIIFEELAAGRLTMNTMVTVSPYASRRSHEWDWIAWLSSGSRHSVATMLRLIMLPSSNGASIAMAEHISGSEAAFVQRMNETAQRLGMTARFDNSHGARDNLITARSVAILVREFITLYPEILDITRLRNFSFGGSQVPNTNLLLQTQFFYQGADGFKTGTTSAAGHCLSATAMRDGRRVITVVMNANGNPGRYGDTTAMLNFGFAELARRDNLMNAIGINLSANVAAVRRNDYYTLTAQLTNVNTGSFTAHGGGWIINGQTAATFGPFAPSTQQTFSIRQLLPTGSPLTEINAEFFVNLPGAGRVSATLTLPVSTEPPLLFRDIPGHWGQGFIYQAYDLDLMNGLGDGRFDPDGHFTRAQAAIVLWNMEGRPTGYVPAFIDVPAHAWYANAIGWLSEYGIVQGHPGNRFAPGDPVTRQELFVMLRNYAALSGYDVRPFASPQWPFADDNLLAWWGRDAAMWANFHGIAVGSGGRLNPTGTTTRAEAATMLVRFANADLPPAPESVDIEPLLRAEFDEVKHLFGNVVDYMEETPWGTRYYEFDTNAGVHVLNGLVSSIHVHYQDSYPKDLFHFDGINGYSTSADIRAALGAPTLGNPDGMDFGLAYWYWLTEETGEVATLAFRFLEDGTLTGISIWDNKIYIPDAPPAPIDVQSLLWAEFDEVKHLFGNVVSSGDRDGWSGLPYYLFDTNVTVHVRDGLVDIIHVRYQNDDSRTRFHFDGLNGYSTSADVRAALGETAPNPEADNSWSYAYFLLDADGLADRAISIHFSEDDRVIAIVVWGSVG
ncbi:MAG: S-layer homology domain-containing protein [Oscillospiraceae bacterium]|nr:S-layer homology domain-containing protein [Oscillospiraceae bacterium]